MDAELAKLPNGHIFDAKDFVLRFTTDLIGITAFGLKAKSLEYSEESEFYKTSKKVFEITPKRAIEMSCFLMFPSLIPILNVKFVPSACANFMRNIVRNVVQDRRESGLKRNDVIDKIIELQNMAKLNPKDYANDFDYIVGQAFNFIIAGTETSSSTSAFALFELARNPSIQDKLREEIVAALEDGTISYETLCDMSFLSQVIDETLRLYPITGLVERQMTSSIKAAEISLLPEFNLSIPKNVPLYVSLLGLHRDEKVCKLIIFNFLFLCDFVFSTGMIP